MSDVKATLAEPDYVKRSSSDKKVLLYYRFVRGIFQGKHVLVVVKTDDRNFVVTAYITDRIKKGEEVWRRQT